MTLVAAESVLVCPQGNRDDNWGMQQTRLRMHISLLLVQCVDNIAHDIYVVKLSHHTRKCEDHRFIVQPAIQDDCPEELKDVVCDPSNSKILRWIFFVWAGGQRPDWRYQQKRMLKSVHRVSGNRNRNKWKWRTHHPPSHHNENLRRFARFGWSAELRVHARMQANGNRQHNLLRTHRRSGVIIVLKSSEIFFCK